MNGGHINRQMKTSRAALAGKRTPIANPRIIVPGRRYPKGKEPGHGLEGVVLTQERAGLVEVIDDFTPEEMAWRPGLRAIQINPIPIVDAVMNECYAIAS